jgi:hypothetical protein
MHAAISSSEYAHASGNGSINVAVSPSHRNAADPVGLRLDHAKSTPMK